MLPDYSPVFLKYNEELKPLISEIEGRVERFSQPLLMNLASVFDYLSISAAEGQDSQKNLDEANKMLDLCISQSYMSLIYAIRNNTDAFEKSVGKAGMKKLDNGHFIGPYTNLRKQRNSLMSQAECQDEREAKPLFEQAYKVVTRMEAMVNKEKPNLSIVQSEKLSMIGTLLRWVLSIAISVLVGLLVNHFGG